MNESILACVATAFSVCSFFILERLCLMSLRKRENDVYLFLEQLLLDEGFSRGQTSDRQGMLSSLAECMDRTAHCSDWRSRRDSAWCMASSLCDEFRFFPENCTGNRWCVPGMEPMDMDFWRNVRDLLNIRTEEEIRETERTGREYPREGGLS